MNMPTAFDKEKVIEELKGQIELISYNPMMAGKYIKKDRAIKIVEKGGIEWINQKYANTPAAPAAGRLTSAQSVQIMDANGCKTVFVAMRTAML